MFFYEIISLVLVGLLWGGTNPLIKRNSEDIVKIQADSKIYQFLLEFKYLATNFRYIIPMGLNQFGSIVYVIALQNIDLTISVPVANSLTFVFTAISGWILGEKLPKKNGILGIAFILLGTTLCCLDRYWKHSIDLV